MAKNKYSITKEEIESIKSYISKDHLSINSIVETALDNEERIETILGYEYLTKEDIKKHIENIRNIYSAILKYSYNIEEEHEIYKIYRGTNLDEVKKMRSSKKYNRFCSATIEEDIARKKYTAPWVDKAVLEISLAVNVPYLDTSKILDSKESEIIVSPFTRVNKIEKSDAEEDKYIVTISKVELEKEASREEKVYNDTEDSNQALKELFSLRKEIKNMYKTKDELLSKLLNSDFSKKADEKKKINEEVKALEKEIENKTNQANKLEVKYSSWKRELNSLVRTNLKEVEDEVEKEAAKVLEAKRKKEEEEKKRRKEEEEKKIKELVDTSVILDNDEKMQKAATENLSNMAIELNPVINSLKEIAMNENIIATSKINKIKMDFNTLDRNQKKYDDFAKKLATKYNKKINIIDLKESLYDLESSITKLGRKIEKTKAEDSKEEYFTLQGNIGKEINEKLEVILKDNLSQTNKEELVEFRKGIYEKVIVMKSKMDLKDLTEQRKKLETKLGIIKLLDKITGKAKKDDIVLDNIDIKIASINSSLKTLKNKEIKSVSVHKMITILDEYISKNIKKTVLKKEVSEMQKLRVALSNIFNIDEKRITKENAEKQISNLPTTKNKNKISFEELEKWKTNDWIKRNGYVYIEKKNIEIQEKTTIIDYIKVLKKEVDNRLKR